MAKKLLHPVDTGMKEQFVVWIGDLVCSSEESFPRLGQLIVDYDPPIKKLADEFIPHAKVQHSFNTLFIIL